VLKQLNRTSAQLEAEIGKPLADLDRTEMSGLLRMLQDGARELTAERHRAYLPESVDTFEARYLGAAQESGAVLRFTFDVQRRGSVIGSSLHHNHPTLIGLSGTLQAGAVSRTRRPPSSTTRFRAMSFDTPPVAPRRAHAC
jgi:hypothetical protein